MKWNIIVLPPIYFVVCRLFLVGISFRIIVTMGAAVISSNWFFLLVYITIYLAQVFLAFVSVICLCTMVCEMLQWFSGHKSC